MPSAGGGISGTKTHYQNPIAKVAKVAKGINNKGG